MPTHTAQRNGHASGPHLLGRADDDIRSPSSIPRAARSPERQWATFRWLIRLRWYSVAGQCVTILVVYYGMGIALPLPTLLALVGVTAVSNGAGLVQIRRRWGVLPRWLPCGLVATDVVVLTLLLAFTGGAGNPFASFYLVYSTMAALALGVHGAWIIWILSSAGYGSLFVLRDLLPQLHHHAWCGPAMDYNLHLQGMLVAFLLTSASIAYFVNNMIRTLREQQAALDEAREREAGNERFASLATLAAGVAHEIGSPLGTISIAAGELKRAAALKSPEDAECIREDADLIAEEVNRCRRILDRLSQEAEPMDDQARWISLTELIEALETIVHPTHRSRLKWLAGSGMGRPLFAPRLALAQALGVLIKNAAEACPGETPIVLTVQQKENSACLSVEDSGHGMTPEQLTHAGEPFFTTKEPGKGMGLGLYLVRLLAERLQGSLELHNRAQGGMRVTLVIPQPMPGPG